MKKREKNYSPAKKPLLIYYYGAGKGKTTAALGTALRAAGAGMHSIILQAIKGDWPSGERISIPKYFKNCITIKALGKGFVGIMGDSKDISEHIKAARDALSAARDAIGSGRYNLIVLDEFGDLPTLKLISATQLTKVVKNANCHIIITGHKPIREIIDIADIVTEMKKVKHHYDSGIIASKGVDF